MQTYIGRQPIFNKEGECLAYELLYRSCEVNNSAKFTDNAKATARVIVNLIHTIGFPSIIGTKKGYINLDESMLFSDALLLLPKEQFGFEILEYTAITQPLIERIAELHAKGYTFSLDDFDCSEAMLEAYTPIFPYIDTIKVDIQAVGLHNLHSSLEKLAPYKIALLAEKIETQEEFTACLNYDFHLFQGYFFEKPIILSGQKIEPNTISAINLINCMQENDDIAFISNKFSTCPDLVYNLLRHVNSGAYHFKQKITSITQMITLLGSHKILSWLGLFLYGAAHERPFSEELFNNAKFRAKVMEELMLTCKKPELANKAFLTGSLSLIDAYLNISMLEFLNYTQLDDEIKTALLFHEGFLGELLNIATHMNHNITSKASFKIGNQEPCFTMEQLYEACHKALLFVEETAHA
ncbi:EAL and HDOD domain-containing protein [Sulfurospirillum barnesii]|uniref:Putative signal transduction protein containing EAL and modified HD-GYP domains n=1 Tax=Sulfurospirillum barnesii (strain ATCC 700032 / DSM 10660 / SES-3) TaxID=760154 RepID=I3XYM8_SULBS|nr:EAL domain-containing protein [Sulfurospirillum barnesii]AFL69052.1 putative signal transduction protein containing EAL and modified HD-GYP domains [Sulfurospirillum barnesii SES-3]